jgi:hypothetical protein
MFHSRLRVRIGPSMDKLVCITDKVNSGKAHDISSELFEGKVAINIKGFTNPSGEELSTEYFDREDRKGITWSIQVQGASEHLGHQSFYPDAVLCQAGSYSRLQRTM